MVNFPILKNFLGTHASPCSNSGDSTNGGRGSSSSALQTPHLTHPSPPSLHATAAVTALHTPHFPVSRKLTELTPNLYVLIRCITLLRIKTSEGLVPFLPSTWVPNLYLLPYHSTSATQSRLGSRSHRRERASTCTLRDACSPLTETPFQAPSSRHGRWTAQVSRASKFDSSPSLQPDNGYVACIFPLPLGLYDTQYAQRTAPECRGRLKTDEEGKYGCCAVVPVLYFIKLHSS